MDPILTVEFPGRFDDEGLREVDESSTVHYFDRFEIPNQMKFQDRSCDQKEHDFDHHNLS
ncbi:hypothetical protein Ancab_012492 [Ancistrocladus abbreviatus]